jgi:hypothetical protein
MASRQFHREAIFYAIYYSRFCCLGELCFSFFQLGVFCFSRNKDVLAFAIEFVLDGQDEQAGEQHECPHDVVAEIEGTRRDFDPSHHVRADPAAEVAAGVDESDGTSCCRTREECCRDRPPNTHGCMDADSGEADKRKSNRQAVSKRGKTETKSTDEQRDGYMPDFVACFRRRFADDELDNESSTHRDGDSTAEQRSGKTGKFFEDGRHPEVEAPETNDPEEIDEAELEDFRVTESLENRVFFTGIIANAN